MAATIIREMLAGELVKGLSRRELGKRIGIPFTSVNNYLDTDTQPSLRTMEKIAAYFRVSVASLVGQEATPQPRIPDVPDPEPGQIYKALFEISNRLNLLEACYRELDELKKRVEQLEGWRQVGKATRPRRKAARGTG